MQKKFAVIGLGRFGQHLARALALAEAEVIAIDRHGKLVEQIRDDVTLAVRLDSTDEDALKAQNVHEVDVAVVSIGDDFESEALTVAVLKGLGVGRIIARSENEMQTRILMSIGADETVSPEQESSTRWAHRLMLSGLKHYIELGDEHSIVHATAPLAFHGKALHELDMRNTYGVNLIAIERERAVAEGEAGGTARSVIVPSASTKVLPSDVLILLGTNDDLSKLPKD